MIPARLSRETEPSKTETSLWVLGSLVTFKVRSAEYTLLEASTPPGKSPPPFVHHEQDALVCVLEGEYEVSGRKLSPGACSLIPKDSVRSVAVVGGEPGRCLVILTPPGPAESFFEEVGAPCVDGGLSIPPEEAPGMEEVLASAKRHGIEFLVTPV